MSEENQTDESTEPSESGDDPRFEVKWRKKTSSSPSPNASTVAEPDTGEDTVELRRQLQEAERRAADLQDRWHRAQADLSNLRKRTEQDKGDVEKFAAMMLVAELLPVLDNFERALSTIPGNLRMLSWIQGVMLIERHFRAILEQLGVAPIEAQGQLFNPHLHEAIAEKETEAVDPGHVAQVYQQGYSMHGRVIRPALVELALAPKEQPSTTTEPESTDDSETEDIVDEAETENTGP